MNQALILALRARGDDAASALEAGMIERSDEEHLEYATAEGRAVYTGNIADFCRLHAEWLGSGKAHAGLILVQQQQYSVGEQMRRVLKRMAARSSELPLCAAILR